ncbi:hypothetical protein JCM3765_006157 [Sporobolomyces pararoseus]
MTITVKVTHALTSTTRKLLLSDEKPLAYDSLLDTILSRFNLQGQAELVYKDEDGDVITLSSNEELVELAAVAHKTQKPLRFDLKLSGKPSEIIEKKLNVQQEESVVSGASSPKSSKQGTTDSLGETSAADRNEEEEEWTRVQAAESAATSQTSTPVAVERTDPTTPTLPFEDPDETPLPSTSDLAREQAAREFPSSSASSSISSSHPDTFPDDPLDLPLPTTSDDTLPFSSLPNSLSSFLASLGNRSSTFSSTLASALSPTSPHSPTSRLSTILSASSLDDIPLVASSLVQMGSEFAEIAKDVALGVRREADEIRGEFVKLREEVERERGRFRDEIRDAVNQASTPRSQEEEDIEPDQVNPTPGTFASPPDYAQSSRLQSNVAESVRSSIASSSIPPQSTSTVSRETSRLLHKQAKQARKDYRAAVRQAREEKKRSRCGRTGQTGEEQQTGSASGYHIPGEMPSSSSSGQEKV